MFKINKDAGLSAQTKEALDYAIAETAGTTYSLGGQSYKSIVYKLHNSAELAEMAEWFNNQPQSQQDLILKYLANHKG